MLTVKLINSNGYEQIREAIIVERSLNDEAGRYEIVAYSDGDGPTVFGSDGLVYVMNDKGQTVAKYDLAHMGVPAIDPPNPSPIR